MNNTSNITIKKADHTIDDAVYKRIAEIHIAEIPAGFLSGLGEKFLTRLYQELARATGSFLLIAFDDKRVAGFLCAGVDTKSIVKTVLKRSAFSLFPTLLLKLLSFKTVKKVIETLKYPSQKISLDLPASEILNFCVSSAYQRKGMGRKLFVEMVEEFKRRSVYEIKIVTGENQQRAQSFYESLDAVKVAEIEVHKGVKSMVYVYKIT